MYTHELLALVSFVTKFLGDEPLVNDRDDDCLPDCEWPSVLIQRGVVYVEQDEGTDWMTIVGYCAAMGYKFEVYHSLDAVREKAEESAA